MPQGAARIARAIELFCEFVNDPERESMEAFLARHVEHRDLLEPMLQSSQLVTFVQAPPDPDEHRSVYLPAQKKLASLGERTDASGRYRIVEEIGQGGMGVVYRARDMDLHRDVAVKVVAGKLLDTGQGAASPSDDMIQRFVDEAQITSQLNHPGIVPVHELGVDDRRRPFMAMQIVHGRTFDQIIELARERKEGFTLGRALEILVRVCETMACAHSKDVIHRDLKPSNVMVGRYGEVYVMDWGLARSPQRPDDADDREDGSHIATDRVHAARAGDSPFMTQEGAILGTPSYMAPEQARGQRQAIGPRSDQYSIGAMLYHLLAGRAPFTKEQGPDTAATILQRLKAGDPRDVLSIEPRAPGELVSICRKAMQREPVQRYETIETLADELRSYLDGRVVRSHRTGVLIELRKWIGRNRAVSLVSLVALVFLLVAGFVYVEGLRRERENQDEKILGLRIRNVIPTIADLEERAASLWPANSTRVADLKAWLAEADAVEAFYHDLEGTPADAFEPDLSRARERMRSFLDVDLRPDNSLGIHENNRVSVRRRFRFASALRRMSCTSDIARRLWRACLDDIAARDVYHGLSLTPQEGLLPLGRDAASGRWEFYVLETGDKPGWEGEFTSGHTVLEELSAVVLVLLEGGTLMKDDGSEKTIDPFFISKYELTNFQWSSYLGKLPKQYAPGHDYGDGRIGWKHPVQIRSFDDAVNDLRTLGLSLPEEDLWEYACRAGTRTRYWSGHSVLSLQGVGNVADRAAEERSGAKWSTDVSLNDGYAFVCAVDSLRANPFGLYNVHGNMAEWTHSSVQGPDSVARGGCFWSDAEEATSESRNVAERFLDDGIGIRPAREIDSRK